MIKPEEYVEPTWTIKYYKSHQRYIAGETVRLHLHKLVGVKDGQVVPVETPNSTPYAFVSNKKGSGYYYFLVGLENYYFLRIQATQVTPGRGGSLLINAATYVNHYKVVTAKDKGHRQKLTTAHQKVAERAIQDYVAGEIKPKENWCEETISF